MSIREISPQEALQRQQVGALLLDVREGYEQATGMAAGAVALPLGEVAQRISDVAPDKACEILAICAHGQRSLRAAYALQQLGYSNLASVAGGTVRWIDEGLPMAKAGGDEDFYDRYSRHLRLPEVGEAGQRKLESARVVVLGAGGLGSPAAFYLAAAGVGTLVIADDDVVERSNLQRQILHTDARIGMSKLDSAAHALHGLNPRVNLEGLPERVTSANVDALLDGADVVLDGADNFPVRYLLNDACVKLGIPLVYGAVQRFQGQVSVFDAGRQRGRAPCYRCLFPQPPAPEDAPNCSEAGVLGVLPGVIGMLQATEAIKLILGIGEPLVGRVLMFDALAMRFHETRLAPDPACPVCAVGKPFPGYIDYAAFCAGA
ncbi:MAG: molybdopterin-synthase adenylyltransferase MoeB [Xanthomonadales bacterium]|nr:molybdopterin-synthase adenylyltransferase MoeB [Xanthomonadales bacterium]ODU74356.1 MAG: molybdopterin biosynthesis protein MoeB [Rhodanobacter sp. SCN 69-32]OJY84152.1 MAG: molybdopterin biosynthesis protein MoeB [Xanthomonadales bacterium 66-474]